MLPTENIAPVTGDMRAPDLLFDIIKGIENVNYIDGRWDKTQDVEEGDWVCATANGFEAPGTTAKMAFPVVTGNNRYDAIATGNVTIADCPGMIFQTKKFVPGSYVVGQALTVKDLGNGEKIPSAAGSSDQVCGRVFAMDAAKGVMQILVVQN
jgi:hypothetical protein